MDDIKLKYLNEEFRLKEFTLEMHDFAETLTSEKVKLIKKLKEESNFSETPIDKYKAREVELTVSISQLSDLKKPTKEQKERLSNLLKTYEVFSSERENDTEYKNAVKVKDAIEEKALMQLAKDKELMFKLYSFVDGKTELIDFKATGKNASDLIIFNVLLINSFFFSTNMQMLESMNGYQSTN